MRFSDEGYLLNENETVLKVNYIERSNFNRETSGNGPVEDGISNVDRDTTYLSTDESRRILVWSYCYHLKVASSYDSPAH